MPRTRRVASKQVIIVTASLVSPGLMVYFLSESNFTTAFSSVSVGCLCVCVGADEELYWLCVETPATVQVGQNTSFGVFFVKRYAGV